MSDKFSTFELDTLSIIFESHPQIEGGEGIDVGDSLVVSRVRERPERHGGGDDRPATDRPLWKVNKDGEVKDVFDAGNFRSLHGLGQYLAIWEEEGDDSTDNFEGRGIA